MFPSQQAVNGGFKNLFFSRHVVLDCMWETNGIAKCGELI